MYSYLWHILPGPGWLKALILLIAAVIIFFVLMQYVFPWADTKMPFNDISVH